MNYNCSLLIVYRNLGNIHLKVKHREKQIVHVEESLENNYSYKKDEIKNESELLIEKQQALRKPKSWKIVFTETNAKCKHFEENKLLKMVCFTYI